MTDALRVMIAEAESQAAIWAECARLDLDKGNAQAAIALALLAIDRRLEALARCIEQESTEVWSAISAIG